MAIASHIGDLVDKILLKTYIFIYFIRLTVSLTKESCGGQSHLPFFMQMSDTLWSGLSFSASSIVLPIIYASYELNQFCCFQINCYSLNSIGPTMEHLSGPKRYLAIYMTSAIASNNTNLLNTSVSSLSLSLSLSTYMIVLQPSFLVHLCKQNLIFLKNVKTIYFFKMSSFGHFPELQMKEFSVHYLSKVLSAFFYFSTSLEQRLVCNKKSA